MTTCLAALLTPPGAAAVAIIAIVGTDAWTIASAIFRADGGMLPFEPDPSRIWIGSVGKPPGDSAVLCTRHAEWVEIHCHGGPQLVRWLLDDLATRGAATVGWEDLIAGGDLSSLRRLAAIELSRAVTTRTAAILLDQYHGALDSALAAIIAAIGRAEIDHAREQLSTLLRFAEIGRHLTRPWHVAIAGPPNVGKSSLINALVGYERCVVTALAGTTRDVVATAIAVNGWPVELCDTAGQRATDDPLESTGIAHARHEIESADLVLWLIDLSSPTEVPPPTCQRRLIVGNKLDLVIEPSQSVKVAISAKTGQGIDALLEAVSQRLAPQSPPPGAPLPFTPDLADRLDEIANQLSAGSVNSALAALAESAGETRS